MVNAGAAALIAFFMLVLVVGIIAMFALIAMLVRDHRQAKEYRKLLELYQQNKTEGLAGGWSITYKLKGKTKTRQIEGATEGEAVANFLRSTEHDTIVAIKR